MEKPSDWLSVEEAAKIKGVEPDSVRRRINRGRLPATKKSDVWLIRRRDLDGWTVQRKRHQEQC